MSRSIEVVSLLLAAAVALMTTSSLAGSFDPQGNFAFDSNAIYTESFEDTPSWDPGDPDAGVDPPEGAIENLAVSNASDALEGNRVAGVDPTNWWESVELPIPLPATPGSYRASAWVRSGSPQLVFVADYESHRSGRVLAALSPTGRCTSDGWVEVASAPFSVDGGDVIRAYLSLQGKATLDAVEILPAGTYAPEVSCRGAFDAVCGEQAICLDDVCRPGAGLVPLLPPVANRDRVVDLLHTRIQYFFGGYRTRRDHLPAALDEIEAMRSATSAWTFWNGFATAVRRLGDWHTAISGLIRAVRTSRKLNVCFIEGDADLSHAQWPSDPRYLDVLVSHVGADRTAGLRPGDRLVAVDGIHPIAWAQSLVGVSWSWWRASDDSVYGEFVEMMRDLITMYARTLTVLRCDAATGACSDSPEVIDVDTLAESVEGDGPLVHCDNRPAYHLEDGPDPATHEVRDVYVGPLVDSEPGENLYGMTWDSLWGPAYTSVFKATNEEFKQKARGVILDHRAGNGGTIDAPEAVTELVRERFDLAIFIFDRPSADYEGPVTEEEGLAIFNRYKVYDDSPDLTYTVGSNDPKLDLPVALILHRDGSASDYLPLGMKGAPKVRIFGPHRTAGAFSSFFQLSLGGGLGLQFASGDTITFEGKALIGHGAEPDEIVEPLQSDLIHGRDTLYLRALEWVRSELKP